MRLFSVLDTATDKPIHGLDNVGEGNALLLRLALDQPLSTLAVGQSTYGRRDGETVRVIRRDDADDAV